MTSVHPPFDTRIFHRECVTLAAAGYPTTLVVPGVTEQVVDGVQLVAVPAARGRLRRMVVTVWKVYRRAQREGGALYHFHDPELIPAGVLLKLAGKRVVYDVHEYHSEVIATRVPGRFCRPARWLLQLFLERIPARLFDRLVFPTRSLSEEYADPRRSTVVYNYPRLDESDRTAERAAEAKYDVIFVGTVSPFRMRIMVEAASQLAARRPSFRWIFVGISAATVEWVRENYPPDFVAAHLVFESRVPYERVQQYLRESRVGYNYHPPEKRFLVAVPMKVYEYMLAGLPVVTSALPELASMLQDGLNVIFPASDSAADHAEAIERLLADPDLASRVGREGRRTVLERVNWDATEAPALLGLYRDLLGA